MSQHVYMCMQLAYCCYEDLEKKKKFMILLRVYVYVYVSLYMYPSGWVDD